MKAIIPITLLTILTTSAVFLFNSEFKSLHSDQPSQDSSLYQLYQQWKQEFGQNTQGEEDHYRFTIFVENYKYIEEFNAQETGSLRLGMNQFGALNIDEFKSIYTSDFTSQANAEEEEVQDVQVEYGIPPVSIDWVAKGAVTPVEFQGQCASCWAFIVKSSLEGIYKIKTGILEQFSAQQLVDCSTSNFGCSGGDPMMAYRYTQTYGIQKQMHYPYTSAVTKVKGACKYNATQVVLKNTSSVRISPKYNVLAIKTAVAVQPLAIEVDAGNKAFQFYKLGIINSSTCTTRLNHGVVLTGYDASTTKPYWRIKNTWGTSWGENGYAKIAITGDGYGMCGIQQYAAYPTWTPPV